jgi:outer membrane immunogenic protein
MKSLFTASVSALALIAGLASVQAADIQQRPAVVKAPPMVAPIFTWTGPYVGINGGWGFGTGDHVGGAAPGSVDIDGALLGVTAGYNWQVNQAVFGIEGDINWTDISGRGTCTGPVGCTTQNNWLGTVRGRLGWAAGQFMPYVTGGLAVGDIEARSAGAGKSDSTQAGWVLGAGVEAALWGPVSAKIEYLFVDLGRGDAIPGTGGSRPDFQTSIIRAGLNYRF